MGKLTKNQSGFGLIGVLLAIVAVGLVGFTGWYVWNANKNASDDLKSTNSDVKFAHSKKEPAQKDAYSGWQKYCSIHEKACFSYPANWTLQNDCTTDPSLCQGLDMDRATVISPNKSSVTFESWVTGRGGMCDKDTPHYMYTKVEELTNVKGVYLVYGNRSDVVVRTLGLLQKDDGSAPKLGDTGTCFGYTQFPAKNTKGQQASLHAAIVAGQEKDDLQNAILILKSYKYE